MQGWARRGTDGGSSGRGFARSTKSGIAISEFTKMKSCQTRTSGRDAQEEIPLGFSSEMLKCLCIFRCELPQTQQACPLQHIALLPVHGPKKITSNNPR
jgi:hypothetical protein